jgi:hypothetical protein
MKIVVFRNVMPRSLADGHRCFRGTYHLHFKVHISPFFYPQDGGNRFLQTTGTYLHGIIPLKNVILTFTTVRTTNHNYVQHPWHIIESCIHHISILQHL